MSHETKAGVAVSVTFLCLASTVLFVRLRPSDVRAATDAETELTRQTQSIPPDPISVQGPAAPPYPLPPGIIQTGAAAPLPPPGQAAAATNETPAATPAVPSAENTSLANAVAAATGAAAPAPAPVAPMNAAVNSASANDNANPSAPSSSPSTATPAPAPAAASNNTGGAPNATAAPLSFEQILASQAGANNAATPTNPAGQASSPSSPTPAAPAPGTTGSTSGSGSPAPAPLGPGLASPPPPSPENNVQLPPPPNPAVNSPGAATSNPAPAVAPAPPAPLPALSGGAAAPSPQAIVPETAAQAAPGSATPPAAAAFPSIPPGPNPAPIGNSGGPNGTLGSNAPTPPAQTPPLGASGAGATPRPATAEPPRAASQFAQAPPIGASPAVGAPPIRVPTTAATPESALPQVEVYDEVTHRCKTGDTFESICKEKYGAEKYAGALLQFNRNHFRPAEGILRQPPALQEGQPVYLPPVSILEKHYANAIPGGMEPQQPAATLIQPAGLPNASRPNGATTTSGEKTYRVRASGEMIGEIAKRTLGSLERWPEIQRLNPQYNPAYALRPGSVLRMPADAQIEPGDGQ